MACTVVGEISTSRAIRLIDVPRVRNSFTLRLLCSGIRGLPRRLPLARALASPAMTRSLIIARSNSANTLIIWKRARPAGVVVSTAC